VSRKTVCLNMIVKNEAHVIERCLASVRPLIDRWLIVDTGSSDGTQDVIRRAMADLPGELLERPWRNFGFNRTEALQLARPKADYLFFIDADDALEFAPGFDRSALDADAYEIDIHYGELHYRRIAMVSTALDWRWEGVLHEYLECAAPARRAHLRGVTMRILGGGGRSQIDEEAKFTRDAEILEAALRDTPGNTRYAFYLAQSYRDAQQPEKALAAYERRVAMGGFAEEVFYSLLQTARLARRLGHAPADVIERYLQAHESRPTRAEALGDLAMYLREQGNRWAQAYLFAQRAIELPQPDDVLFVEPEWYQWRCLDEFAIAAYWIGEYQRSREACERLLAGTQLPAVHRARVEANLDFALKALAAKS
jgi:glycosyltransferase involved in cell wall biosynthesis